MAESVGGWTEGDRGETNIFGVIAISERLDLFSRNFRESSYFRKGPIRRNFILE